MKTAVIGTNVTATENNQEHITFAQTIDFEPLFDHIRAFAKVDCDFGTPEIWTDRVGEVHISYESEELSNQTGPFAAILKECRIGSFSSNVFSKKETGEPGYFGSASLQYQHKDGGSNGMEVIRCSYSDSDGWIFRDAGAR